jgi:hypothetical protein
MREVGVRARVRLRLMSASSRRDSPGAAPQPECALPLSQLQRKGGRLPEEHGQRNRPGGEDSKRRPHGPRLGCRPHPGCDSDGSHERHEPAGERDSLDPGIRLGAPSCYQHDSLCEPQGPAHERGPGGNAPQADHRSHCLAGALRRRCGARHSASARRRPSAHVDERTPYRLASRFRPPVAGRV